MYTPLSRIAFIGNYPPRRCGIATYTRDLRNAVAREVPEASCTVFALEDGSCHEYPAEVVFECPVADDAAYSRAADFLNLQNVSVVSLQHEYGIFGGSDGSHIGRLLGELRAPIHTTLHTVLANPSLGQRQSLDEVLRLSTRVAVMNERGRVLLRETHGISDDKIDVIPHGIPDMPLTDPQVHQSLLGLQGRKVLLTFGLLSPNKGIETVIEALPRIVAKHPRTTYVVLGATHPHVLRRDGEEYRQALMQMAMDLGVRENVIFHDRYVDMPELMTFIGAADVYVTPYLGEDQITSGTLSYAFGCGKPVVSTPYWHAREMLADGRGVLFPFADSAALAAEVIVLLDDHGHRRRMGDRAWALGREMVWERVAERFVDSFRRTRLAAAVRIRTTVAPSLPLPSRRLPDIKLSHLRMPLLAAGDLLGSEAASDAGLAMLEWLSNVQRSPSDRFAPVGCRGFMARGGAIAPFDQQPIDAHATVSACIEAYRATGEIKWVDGASSAFDWFLGQNAVGMTLCDPHTGGCRDGISRKSGSAVREHCGR